MILIIGRHGASVDYENIDQDVDIKRQTKLSKLSHSGKDQAHLQGRQVSIYRPDVMFTSPYQRARETAEIVAEYSPQLFPNIIEDLAEIRRIVDGHSIYSQLNLDYKKWRGETLRKADLNARFHPKDESFGELIARQTKFKYYLQKEYDNQTIFASGHSQAHGMLMASCLLGDKPDPRAVFEFFNRHFMSHGAISILTWDYRKGWQMKDSEFNITKHLK